MKLSDEIYHETFQTQDHAGIPLFHAVTAIQLTSCPSSRMRELNSRGFPITYFSKQIDLINTLHQPDSAVTYAIRYISNPHPESFTSGTIDVCIFCKTTSSTLENTVSKSQHETENLLIQLCGTLSDYNWLAVNDPDQFRKLWLPLDWENAEIVEIRRREELVALDSIQTSRMLGFTETLSPLDPPETKPIYFVHPFLPHSGQLERLLRIMLLNRDPIVLTTILKPVRLTGSEEQAILDEISHCERLPVNLSSNVHRIQAQRAAMVSQALMSQLLNLQDAPFQTTISVASQKKIPIPLAESVGIAVSAPVGEGADPHYTEPTFIQMGGYDVVLPDTENEYKTARCNAAFLAQDYWGRSLTQDSLQRLRYLMAGQEAANAFHFPEDQGNGLAGIDVHMQRTRPVPNALLQTTDQMEQEPGLLLGTNNYLGIPQKVYLPNKDRLTHMYIVGQTGTGKSTLLKTMILSDILAGRGCALIDPHGDLFDDLLRLIPPERIDDVILFDPTDLEFPIGMNLLEAKDSSDRYIIVREMVAIFRRLLEDQYGRMAQEYTGPIFYQHMQMNMLLAMSDLEHPGTLLQFYQIYQSQNYWKRWIPLKVVDPQLELWIENFLSRNNYTERARGGEPTMGEYLSSKFTDFIFDPRLRNIFGQPRSTVNFQQAMNEGKILLINLAKGLLGEANSRFLGLIIMAKFQTEIMKRASIPLTQRKPFFIYVDEFQSLATENFTILLSEARKFGVGLTLANQFVSQIKDERIIQAVFGNVGSLLSFRLGREDAPLIEPQYLPYFDSVDLSNLPNWQIAARLNVKGKGLAPFTIHTALPDEQLHNEHIQLVKEKSRKKYGTPLKLVNELITDSLKETVSQEQMGARLLGLDF